MLENLVQVHSVLVYALPKLDTRNSRSIFYSFTSTIAYKTNFLNLHKKIFHKMINNWWSAWILFLTHIQDKQRNRYKLSVTFFNCIMQKKWPQSFLCPKQDKPVLWTFDESLSKNCWTMQLSSRHFWAK